ncbi:MAG: xylanase [Clostridia bacterium]|nr:xylanase [Clostridia bacterium]
MKKAVIWCLLLALACGRRAACAGETDVHIDEKVTYQTVESFGASGCWWSQYMGLWDMPYDDTGRAARDQLATLLYDRNFGIGLTNYRYNLGAGSADSGKGEYGDPHRRAQSFETAPGVYDWNKDAGAVWFLNKVTELGAQEVVLFFNSPLERLTENGTAQMIQGGSRTNIDPAQYAAWAVYACDVAEHFIQSGVPVRFISPINEPQWDWYAGNQEGCHYEPQQIAGVYKAFLEEMERRPALAAVELSGPESGEWGGKTTQYVSAILNTAALNAHFSAIDCHSYWSDTQSKVSFMNWMRVHAPDKKIRMSEWCEMVNGTDVGMDSALVLAHTLAEDLTVLNAVSWSVWVGVSPGGYHDGLIHAAENGAGGISLVPLKRLWAYGNYTRFIRPGFTRVEVTGGEDCQAVAFTGQEYGKQKLVAVLINDSQSPRDVKLSGAFAKYDRITAYETSAARNLVKTAERVSNTAFTLAPLSVTTIVFTEE